MAELFTSLPRHLYCWIERKSIGEGDGLERASWFGLTSVPGRAWGLSLLLECGAVYGHVPPHVLIFARDLDGAEINRQREWPLFRAQRWDCFGVHFAVHVYEQLDGRSVRARIPGRPGFDKLELGGTYLFTAQHYGDSYSHAPEQAKQFHFIELENGRLTALPANDVLFHDDAFTVPKWPTWLRRQTRTYTAE